MTHCVYLLLQQNLTVDWNEDHHDYECGSPYLVADNTLKATLEQEYIPPAYIVSFPLINNMRS